MPDTALVFAGGSPRAELALEGSNVGCVDRAADPLSAAIGFCDPCRAPIRQLMIAGGEHRGISIEMQFCTRRVDLPRGVSDGEQRIRGHC